MTLAFPKPSVGTNCPVLPTCCLVQIFSYQPTRRIVKESSRYWATNREGGSWHTQTTMHMLYAHSFSVCGCAQVHISRTCTHKYARALTIITNPLQHLNLELFGSQCYLSWTYMTHQWKKKIRERQRGRKSLTNNAWMCLDPHFNKTLFTIHSPSWKCRLLFYPMTLSEIHINISR